jgi:hypothetical protein
VDEPGSTAAARAPLTEATAELLALTAEALEMPAVERREPGSVAAREGAVRTVAALGERTPRPATVLDELAGSDRTSLLPRMPVPLAAAAEVWLLIPDWPIVRVAPRDWIVEAPWVVGAPRGWIVGTDDDRVGEPSPAPGRQGATMRGLASLRGPSAAPPPPAAPPAGDVPRMVVEEPRTLRSAAGLDRGATGLEPLDRGAIEGLDLWMRLVPGSGRDVVAAPGRAGLERWKLLPERIDGCAREGLAVDGLRKLPASSVDDRPVVRPELGDPRAWLVGALSDGPEGLETPGLDLGVDLETPGDARGTEGAREGAENDRPAGEAERPTLGAERGAEKDRVPPELREAAPPERNPPPEERGAAPDMRAPPPPDDRPPLKLPPERPPPPDAPPLPPRLPRDWASRTGDRPRAIVIAMVMSPSGRRAMFSTPGTCP